jgi:membrane protease YdiL (CAAX protease family)
LARHCRVAEFPEFYLISLVAAALVLFLPWLEWLSGRRGAVGRGPWRLRVPAGSCAYGQVLEVNPRGLWHGCAGFLIAAGLLLSMGVALVPAGFTTLRQPPDGLMSLAMRVLVPALAAAALMEVFFRGVAMGIFLRAMRPSAALGMSAAFFALVLAVVPPAGLDVADPEAPGIGFELLRKTLARFADGSVVAAELLPVLALGCVLAYARWRSASLWLPVGLHTGWLFAKRMLAELYPAGGPADADHSLRLMQQGLLPLTAILLAGVLAHYFTAEERHESSAGS